MAAAERDGYLLRRGFRFPEPQPIPTTTIRLDPEDIATALLATLQGGLLLAQVQRSTRPLETAVDTLIALVTPR